MTAIMTALNHVNAALQERPDFYTLSSEDGASSETWPLFVYGHSPHAAELWRIMARQAGVQYIHQFKELKHVNTELNPSSTAALETGMMWVQKEREFTTQERLVGVTFHPAVARDNIHLMHPLEWHKLFFLMFPHLTVGTYDSEYSVTFTIAWDKPNWELLTSKMKQTILRLNRGIESGEPQNTPLSPDAFMTLSVEFMQMYHVIPYRLDEEKNLLYVFMANIDDDETANRIYGATRRVVQRVFMDNADEQAFWEQYHASNQRLIDNSTD